MATGIWAHEEGASSVRLTPPWEEGGKTKYAGQAALIFGGGTCVGQYGTSSTARSPALARAFLRVSQSSTLITHPSYSFSFYASTAIQCARMQGFFPIITTASPRHTEFLKSLGATHILDRALSPDAICAALPTLTGDRLITYVHDSFGREREVQRLGFTVVAPGGAFVTVNPRDHEFIADLVEESEKRGEGKRVARAFGSYALPGNVKLGDEMCSRLKGWLETGEIVVSRLLDLLRRGG